MLTYKAMFKFVDGGVHGEVLDFPGAMTCGSELDEVRRLLSSALVDMAETRLLQGKSLPVPDPLVTDAEADIEEPIHLLLSERDCDAKASSDGREAAATNNQIL